VMGLSYGQASGKRLGCKLGSWRQERLWHRRRLEEAGSVNQVRCTNNGIARHAHFELPANLPMLRDGAAEGAEKSPHPVAFARPPHDRRKLDWQGFPPTRTRGSLPVSTGEAVCNSSVMRHGAEARSRWLANAPERAVFQLCCQFGITHGAKRRFSADLKKTTLVRTEARSSYHSPLLVNSADPGKEHPPLPVTTYAVVEFVVMEAVI